MSSPTPHSPLSLFPTLLHDNWSKRNKLRRPLIAQIQSVQRTINVISKGFRVSNNTLTEFALIKSDCESSVGSRQGVNYYGVGKLNYRWKIHKRDMKFFNDLCPSSCIDYLLHLPLNHSLKSSIFGRSSWHSKLTRVTTLNPLNATFKAYLLEGGQSKRLM